MRDSLLMDIINNTKNDINTSNNSISDICSSSSLISTKPKKKEEGSILNKFAIA